MLLDVIAAFVCNLDVFCINLAVFFFGYSMFTKIKQKLADAQVETAVGLSTHSVFYVEGANLFPCDDEFIHNNKDKQIFYGSNPENNKIPVTYEEFVAYRKYENYNEKYELLIVRLKRESFLYKTGGFLVIIGTLICLLKSNNVAIAFSVMALFLLIGAIIIYMLYSLVNIVHKINPRPTMPDIHNRL